ncbi:MAG: HNH endonuclease [Dehalococcoidia bacterium]
MVDPRQARRGPPLNEGEWIILLDYFLHSPEPTHTDSHPSCRELAALIGRTSGTVDSSLRNLKAIHTGSVGLSHGGQTAQRVYERYSEDHPFLQARAQELLGHLEVGRARTGLGERQLALERLREFNLQHRGQPASSTSRDITIFHRPRGARSDLLSIVGTTCQICQAPGFETHLSGSYAEVHHLDALARQSPGNLCTDNAVVVCPTCHAKLHNARVESVSLPHGRIRITINEIVYTVERNTEARLEQLAGSTPNVP